MQHLLSALAAATLTALVGAQSPGITTFGTGCSILRQQLSIGHLGTPRLGATFDLTYSGPNFIGNAAQQRAWPFLTLGFQTTNVPIPPVFVQQPPGCTILVTPELTLPMPPDPTGAPSYQAAMSFAVPNDPALTGGMMFAQWFLAYYQCGFVGCALVAVGTSDAAGVTSGP